MQTIKSRNVARRFVLASGLATITLLTGSLALHEGATAAGTPVVKITPNSGPYHTLVVVSGQNFGANEQVAIYKETRAFFAWQTDATGSFVGKPESFNGPGPVNGIFTITAIGRTSGLKATTTFT